MSITVMKQALEALEKVSARRVIMGSTGDYRSGQIDALAAIYEDVAPALTALRQAIEQAGKGVHNVHLLEPVEYTAWQSPHNDDEWLEHPADCQIIDEFDPPVFVGFEYELTAGRYTQQRYRVTKIADDESDDVEVELINPPTAPAQPVVPQGWKLATDERQALERFAETCEDGEGYDVPKEMMRRLAKIGIVYRGTRDVYSITEFGESLLSAAPAQQPLTDEQIKDAVDRADFSTMVTADDYIYVIARAVEAEIKGASL